MDIQRRQAIDFVGHLHPCAVFVKMKKSINQSIRIACLCESCLKAKSGLTEMSTEKSRGPASAACPAAQLGQIGDSRFSTLETHVPHLHLHLHHQRVQTPYLGCLLSPCLQYSTTHRPFPSPLSTFFFSAHIFFLAVYSWLLWSPRFPLMSSLCTWAPWNFVAALEPHWATFEDCLQEQITSVLNQGITDIQKRG